MHSEVSLKDLTKDSTIRDSSLVSQAQNDKVKNINDKMRDANDNEKSINDKVKDSSILPPTSEATSPTCKNDNEKFQNKIYPNYTIRTLKESFLKTGRLDSEYYQSKYDKNEKLIKHYKNGYCHLKDLVLEQSGGFAFSSDGYLENGNLALIRINNIKNANLDMSNAVYLTNEAQNLSPRDKVKIGDILISMSGSVGLACVVREDINAMINQRILKIAISGFSQEVLVILLNSIIAKLQFERMGTGGVQTNLSSKNILEILIPLLDIETQQKIESKITQSIALRAKSKALLKEAKVKVEAKI